MNLTEISAEWGVSKQNVSQIASKAIKKLFSNTRKEYNLTYLETYEMLLVGLNIYPCDRDVKYFFKHLSNSDKLNIDKERENFIRK